MIEKKLSERSKDWRLVDFLQQSVDLFSEYQIDFFAIGSCSSFAHIGHVTRLTRDLDVVVPRKQREQLLKACEKQALQYRIEEGFVRIMTEKYQIHVVHERFKLLEVDTKTVVGEVDLDLREDELQGKALYFPTCRQKIAIKVPLPEIAFLISLLAPVSVNTLSEAVKVFERCVRGGGCDAERFVRRNQAIVPLWRHRLEHLVAVLEGEGRPLAKRLREAADRYDRF